MSAFVWWNFRVYLGYENKNSLLVFQFKSIAKILSVWYFNIKIECSCGTFVKFINGMRAKP